MAPDVLVKGCNVQWSYSDPDDVDGYIVYFGSTKLNTTKYTNYIIENPTDESLIEINTTWSVSIQAYQHLIGPATAEVTIGE